jgi:molecular chaperone GrpE
MSEELEKDASLPADGQSSDFTPGFEAAPAGEEPQLSREQQLEAELGEAKDKYLRTLAEVENFKKRLARERVEERAFAAQEIIQAVLPVADNLERALSSGKAQAPAPGADPALEQLIKGVELVVKQFEDVLKKQGVVPVDTPIGKPFDPHQHQPLLQEPSADHEEGAVLELLQKGYRLGDRLLRPSMVKVATKP